MRLDNIKFIEQIIATLNSSKDREYYQSYIAQLVGERDKLDSDFNHLEKLGREREITSIADKEWFDSDPEGMKQMAKENIEILTNRWNRLEGELLAQVEMSIKDPDQEWLYNFIEKIIDSEMRPVQRKINRFKRILSLEKPQTDDNLTDYDIERAREYPLEQLLGEGSSAGSGKIKYRCPLHDEKTASFIVYLEENKYKCFGCQKYGNPIDLLMERDKLEFIEAVRQLT